MRRGFEGQGLVEYALIILLVVLVTIAAVALLGTTLLDFYFSFSIP